MSVKDVDNSVFKPLRSGESTACSLTPDAELRIVKMMIIHKFKLKNLVKGIHGFSQLAHDTAPRNVTPRYEVTTWGNIVKKGGSAVPPSDATKDSVIRMVSIILYSF